MCRKITRCPEYNRRCAEGLTVPCEDCEYLKQERKLLKRLRIVLAITFLLFLGTTYFKFN